MTSSSYKPSPGSEPQSPWLTALLSQRDLSLPIPINYVTYPGVSVSKACFGHDVFENEAASQCFSNLLATGFRRFVLELYWDDIRRVWSFCPAQLPNPSTDPTTSTSSKASFTSSSVSVSSVDITPRSIPSSDTISDEPSIFAGSIERQATPAAALTSTTTSRSRSSVSTGTKSNTSATASLATSSVIPAHGGLLRTGPYSCTNSIDLPVFAAVLSDYFQSSSNTLAAYITYLTLNLHAAAPSEDPLSTPSLLNASSLPTSKELISGMLRANLSSYLYTPSQIREERANLNSSWYSVAADAQPQLAYFNASKNSKGELSTDNGWPSESFVEFRKASQSYRLLAEFGTIDPALRHYNVTGDDTTIFPNQAIGDAAPIQYGTAGSINRGCFFNADDTKIADGNNSWAISSQILLPSNTGAYDNDMTSVHNLTACGISPLLNQTLLNTTADVNVSPYQSFVYSSIWSWAVAEPWNITEADDKSGHIRCAAFDASSSGRWHVADCSDKNYAACRVGNEPYVWRLSTSRGTYSQSNELCPSGSSFEVPRTALENRHLLSTLASQRRGDDQSKDQVLWLNFNSLDKPNCFVVGVTSTCPYTDESTNTRRQVIVPVVAAVIVFCIAGLTIFIKCAANRRKSKRTRRRRGDDGWDYEGVPS